MKAIQNNDKYYTLLSPYLVRTNFGSYDELKNKILTVLGCSSAKILFSAHKQDPWKVLVAALEFKPDASVEDLLVTLTKHASPEQIATWRRTITTVDQLKKEVLLSRTNQVVHQNTTLPSTNSFADTDHLAASIANAITSNMNTLFEKVMQQNNQLMCKNLSSNNQNLNNANLNNNNRFNQRYRNRDQSKRQIINDLSWYHRNINNTEKLYFMGNSRWRSLISLKQ